MGTRCILIVGMSESDIAIIVSTVSPDKRPSLIRETINMRMQWLMSCVIFGIDSYICLKRGVINLLHLAMRIRGHFDPHRCER